MYDLKFSSLKIPLKTIFLACEAWACILEFYYLSLEILRLEFFPVPKLYLNDNQTLIIN